MKAKRSNYAGVIALFLIGAAGVYAIGVYIKKTPEAQDVPPAIHRKDRTDRTSRQADPVDSSKKPTVTILTPKSDKGNLTFDESTDSVPDGVDPMVFSLNSYFTNSHITAPEAKVLKIEVKDGIAQVDCTEAMDRTHGANDEQAMIQGVAKTLAQFSGIKKAIFFVSGRAIDSWGNVDISQGIDVGLGDATASDDTPKQHGA